MVSADHKLRRKEFHWPKNETGNMRGVLDGDGRYSKRLELLLGSIKIIVLTFPFNNTGYRSLQNAEATTEFS